jgi:hypothetical protein
MSAFSAHSSFEWCQAIHLQSQHERVQNQSCPEPGHVLYSISCIIGGIFGSAIRDVLPFINHELILGIFIYKDCSQSNIYLYIFGKFYMDMPNTVVYRAR